MNTAFQVVSLVGFLLSMAACAGVAYLLTKEREADDTRAKLRSLDLELADLGDRLSHWQRRDANRARRETGGGNADSVGQNGLSVSDGDGRDARKRALRARAAQLKLPGIT